jgi:hypothetical protein
MAALPPWRSTDTAAQPSPLLAKLSAFLPQLAAANEAMLEGDAAVPRIDECLVEKSKDDDGEDDSDDASVADDDDASRDDDDNDEPRAAKKARTAPTIQLDFAVGIDTNDPVMSLLESGGHTNDSSSNDNVDDDNKDAHPDEDAQVVLQNLLRRPAARKAKGPLITEVLEEP